MPLFDPPRQYSAETIRRALDLGVNVKMITGLLTGLAINLDNPLISKISKKKFSQSLYKFYISENVGVYL